MPGAAWAGFLALTVWVAVYLFIAWPAPIYAGFEVLGGDADPAVFGYAGEMLRQGGAPYLSFWDHKGPLLYAIQLAGLSAAGGDSWGVWLIGLIATVGALALGFVALRRAFGAVPALFGIAAAAFSLPNTPAVNMTEQYALPLQFAALFLVARWCLGNRHAFRTGFGLGVLAGAGLVLRANVIGAMVAAAIVLSLVLLRERELRLLVRGVGGAVAGVALIGALAAAWLVAAGSFDAFSDQYLGYNFAYASASWSERTRSALAGLTVLSQNGLLLVAAAGWAVAVAGFRRGVHTSLSPLLLLAIIWAPLELLLASVSGRTYAHYFLMLLPPFSLLAALFAAELRARVMLVAAAAALAVIPIAGLARQLRDEGLAPPGRAQIAAASAYVRANSSADDPLFIWGHAPSVYYESERKPASRFIYVLPLLTPGYADSSLIAGFVSEIRRAEPQLIIDASGGAAGVPALDEWDAGWTFPEGASAAARHWAMTPALRDFYRLVAADYRMTARVGPDQWPVYRLEKRPRI